MGWTSSTSTVKMCEQAAHPDTFPGIVMPFTIDNINNWAESGDLLLRPEGHNGNKSGHVAFFSERVGNGYLQFAAHGHGETPQVGWGQNNSASGSYKYIIRPNPTGWTSQVANTGSTTPLGPH